MTFGALTCAVAIADVVLGPVLSTMIGQFFELTSKLSVLASRVLFLSFVEGDDAIELVVACGEELGFFVVKVGRDEFLQRCWRVVFED